MQTNKPGDHEKRTDTGHLTIHTLADVILQVSALLLESGAHCARINRNIQRIAGKAGYHAEMFISFTAVSISVSEKENPAKTITLNKQVKHHGTHFGVLTGASLLTWDLYDNKIPWDEFENKISTLSAAPKYNIWLVRLFIGIACGCLCLLAGGDWKDGLFTLAASSAGLIVKQDMVKRKFNLMVSIVCSSFTATIISGLNTLYGIGEAPEASIATAVLFLIPGVPLINCIIDLMEGYIPTGIARGAFGAFILLCIAIGMFLSMALIGINYF